MNGPHFKELINTVCKTINLPKYKIAILLGVERVTVNKWEREGVPIRIKPYVISVLRQALLDHIHGGLKYAGDNS